VRSERFKLRNGWMQKPKATRSRTGNNRMGRMKFWHITLFGIILWGIGILPLYWVEEVDLPHRFLGAGSWLSYSGYFAPHAALAMATVVLGTTLVLLSILGWIFRNNTHNT
jgi:hypothetical protein